MDSQTKSFTQRARELVSQMTLAEKVSQMIYNAPAVERLGIPEYNWWNEALHGLGRAGVATVFPQAIGLAATWNTGLMYQVAAAISDEARAKHHEALRRGIHEIYTGLTFWSPNINIFRDPRWGRGQETYGEDPYLTAEMGVAFVKGLQGDDPRYLKLVATPKHYAVHSGPEPDRHHFDAQIDEYSMREFYLFAFEACIKEARAWSVMGAYNRTNGEPCCASPILLQQILREEWGFEGYVVSDCWAIRDIYQHHKVVKTASEAAALAVRNGCQLNCGDTYPALLDAVAQGLISEAELDQALTLLFTARFRLGMFDPPETVPYANLSLETLGSPRHQALALQAARESIVLLKNASGLLPLSKEIASIAVIGPNAEHLQSLLGNYNGTPAAAVTPLQGIRQKVSPATHVYYAPGCAFADEIPYLETIPSSFLRPLDAAQYGSGLSGVYYDNARFEGEPVRHQVDREISFTWKDTSPVSGLWADEFSVVWEGFLVPPVSGTYHLGMNAGSEFGLFLDGERVVGASTIHHPLQKTRAVALEAGRLYHLRINLANQGLDPQAHLLWARPDANLESAALEAAAKADAVVLCLGLSPILEGEEMPVRVPGFEGGDRTDISLPAVQEALLKKIHALGKPVVLVLMGGSALGVAWAAEHVPAILTAWYPGQSGGEAIADVLFGDYNPAGKLPVTFYKSVNDLPPFTDYMLAGHTYRYFQGEPLYPFGHGLSYTNFKLDHFTVSAATFQYGEDVAVTLDLTNTGTAAGEEVVQLYVADPEASMPRPRKALIGYQRVSLSPGETKKVLFTVFANQFGYHDADMDFVLEPRKLILMAGTSSTDLPLQDEVEIVGEIRLISEEKVFFSKAQIL